jgi:hypothetical protein
MSRFAFPDLARAFRDGERFGDATMRVVEVGELVLPTGRIVACDPGYTRSSYESAYTRAVPPGHYPVQLALLAKDVWPANNPFREKVACARVRFQEVSVERWEMALQPCWDPSTLEPGYYLGYGVDGGKGCFLDEAALSHIPDEQPAFDQAFHEVLSKQQWNDLLDAYRAIEPPVLGEMFASSNYIRNSTFGPPCRSALLDPQTGANLICFPSGEGDGCYASYFGIAADGSAACLVTDFGLLVRSVMNTLEIPVPVQEHSELIHPGLADIGIDCLRVEWRPAASEVVIEFARQLYLQEIRFENRPGSSAQWTGSGHHGQGECTGQTWWFRLDEPLQPTARVLLEYTLRTEAL